MWTYIVQSRLWIYAYLLLDTDTVALTSGDIFYKILTLIYPKVPNITDQRVKNMKWQH